MRHIRVIALLLIAGAAWAGPNKSAWDQQIAGGALADDSANYVEAERLFSLACDLSHAEPLGSERLSRG
jgi:hypothetical protein